MSNFYFLTSSLPDLIFDSQDLPVSMESFWQLCSEVLSENESDTLGRVFLLNDLKNIHAALTNSTHFIEPHYFSAQQIQDGLAGEGLFPFLLDFIQNKPPAAEPSRLLDELLAHFYQNLTLAVPPLLQPYFHFELDLKNVTTALGLRRSAEPTNSLLIPDGLAYEALTTSQAVDFGLAQDLDWIQRLLAVYADKEALGKKTEQKKSNIPELVVIEKEIERVRWDWLTENLEGNLFSLGFIISFAVKLSSCLRWAKLDEAHGRRLLEQILERIKNSLTLPAEFKTSKGVRP